VIKEKLKERLFQLRAERRRSEFGAEDMFWSPQDKEDHIKTIDEEIRLTEENQDLE
jgi:hypothetical protein